MWLRVAADSLLCLAFASLAYVLLHLARRRGAAVSQGGPSPPIRRTVVFMIVFTAGAALTHFIEIWSVPTGVDWRVSVRLFAGVAGIAAAVALWRVVPGILALPSAARLQASEEALSRASRELDTFTASMSHDLRAPLTSIAGQAGMLELTLGDTATEDQRRRLQRLQGSVKQMSELIDALVTLSRTSRHAIEAQMLDVTQLAEQVVAELRQKDPQRSVEVTIQPGMSAHADLQLLASALAQLIDNAWKFTSKNPSARIEIGQSRNAARSMLHIRDNGVGFDMTYSTKLFQPFKRLHGPNEFAGAGIGLATASRIVERHGGRIWAEAKPNEGAVFYVELPAGPPSPG